MFDNSLFELIVSIVFFGSFATWVFTQPGKKNGALVIAAVAAVAFVLIALVALFSPSV